ncbi:MAG: hypothetical protein J5I93_00705, partial [Pirellulaceae bacterium]|nr:hypothetical protein [Pirellulaceae bacterium]
MGWHTTVTFWRSSAASGGAWLIWVAGLLVAPTAWGESPADMQRQTAYFRQRIEPVLTAHCYQCHSSGAETLEAGLRLDDPASLRRGGDSGPVLVPGEPDKSLLLQALRHENGLEMPPDQPRLPDSVIRDFRQWIAGGAFDPREPADAADIDPLQAARTHWAFQPVGAAPPPAVHAGDWPQSPVDAFVLARLEARGWRP